MNFKKKIVLLFASLLCGINWAHGLPQIDNYLPLTYQAKNQIHIWFYTPVYERYIKAQYQYQLWGIDDTWSVWSENADVFIENSPSGEFTFNVMARFGAHLSTNIALNSFSINRPWYLSNLMTIAYILAAVLFFIFLHKAYKRYYRKKQEQLIELNRRELELIQLQNEKDLIKLKNDQLKKDFRNKSIELAASTMSIIKKNELLSRVKQQLLASEDDNQSAKQIVSLIDQNLSQNDDWELFKEAFNNADRKFLKKLYKAHSNLSPNEIRLCSYLRLNLSSKEIAGLFNISPRSVEIKRYRLRKKLNLNHEENLVNYLLKL